MPLDASDPLQETPATATQTAPVAAAAAASRRLALDDSLPLALNRDSIQLLLQSPNKLFLYWSFAIDPHTTLRAAFGELAAHYRLAVRLVKMESGEEFVLDAPRDRMQWFEVYPRHVYRADVGFHAPNRPFVCLLSSNILSTPPDSASHISAEEHEFQVQAEDFVRHLHSAGYESYARGLTQETSGDGEDSQTHDQSPASSNRQSASASHAPREAADEYPHR